MRRLALLPLLLAAACAAPETVRARTLEDAIEEGVEHLVATQGSDGFWGRGTGTTGFDVMASVPGSHDAFRTGATALAAMALQEAGEREAWLRAINALATAEVPRRATRLELYNVWAHAYALQALTRAWKAMGGEPKIRDAAQRHLDALARYETYVGGWNYYDFVHGLRVPSMEPTSFGTATGLLALKEAKEAGLQVPDALVRRALARLREMRQPDGSFLYGSDLRYAPLHPANQVKGSLGRTQAGHAALSAWGQLPGSEAAIRAGLAPFFAEHRFLETGRKRQYPHEGWYYTAGYYFYYGHYHAALLLERLPEADALKAELAALLLPLQEPDGSWWDFKLWDYHRAYGTAYAVMTLLRCRPDARTARGR